MSLLTHFPFEPRKVQRDVATKIEQALAEAKDEPVCLVVNMPTGAGKSPLAVAMGLWAQEEEKRAYYTVPNDALQRQVQRDFPQLVSLWGEHGYRCTTYRQSCGTTRQRQGGNCVGCPHTLAVGAAARTVSVMNPYTLLAYRRKKALPTPDVLIIDEAHKIVDFQLAQTQPVKLWRKDHPWPKSISDASDLVRWIDNCEKIDPSPLRRRAKSLVVGHRGDVMINKGEQLWRGKPHECLEIRPLSARWASPVLWNPRKTRVLVLLSATITPHTVNELGLDRYYKVVHIECDSPIPAAARPVYVWPVANMAAANKAHLGAQARAISYLLSHHKSSGFVHATYGEAAELRSLLTSDRLMWHDQGTKNHQLQDFEGRAGSGAVLVGSGMREGIDLKGDKAHWQVVTKVNFPYLGDPWVAMKAERDREWYDAQAVQELLQAVGRVCRGPDDFGSTYILDSQFERLFRDREYMFPQWFKDALRWPK